MAHFRTIKNRYHVSIRKKGVSICSNFSTLEDAELWAKYKEDLIDNMQSFDVPKKELMSLEDAIELKILDLKNRNKDSRTIADVSSLRNNFQEWMEKSINFFTTEMIIEKIKSMTGTTIKVGGHRKNGQVLNNTGKNVVISPVTVMKKFKVLGSVFSYLIENGIDIENVFLKAISTFELKKND